MNPVDLPRVTAVVPTRDRPGPLRATVAAILGQDYPGPVEVLVVYDQTDPDPTLATEDSADTDEPGGAGAGWPVRVVRVLRNGRRPGLAGARNSGILAATGELVAFCDDDDQWLPGKLTAQVAALRAEPTAEFVGCGIRVDHDGRTVDRTLPWSRVPLAALLRDRLTALHPSTFVIRRDALPDGIGLVDEEIPGSYAEDYELLLRAARRTPLLNVAAPHVRVCWHQHSYFAGRWATISTALRWLLDRYPEFETVPAGAARIRGQIAFAEAALGHRQDAVRWARHTLARNRWEPRAYLALAVAGGVLRADRVLRTLHRHGRGI